MTADAALLLVLVTLGAVAMPSLARFVGIPLAVAEIGFGVIIGRTGFAFGDPGNPFLGFLADVGFALFLFLAGLEVDFRELERGGRKAVLVPFVMSLASFAGSFAIASWLGWGPWVALAVGATSVPLLLSVVREVGLAGTPLGARMITGAAVGEIVTVALLAVAELWSHAADAAGAIAGGLRLGLLVAAVFTGAAVLRAVLWWYPKPFVRMVARDDPSEIGVRFGFGLMFAMVGLARLAGIEPVLGAFLAGLMLGYTVRRKGELEHKLASMAYGFFVPVFFIHVGMRLHVEAETLRTHGGFVLQVVLAMFVVKAVPQLTRLLGGRRLNEMFGYAFLLASPLTLVIAVVDLGGRVGAVDAATEAAVVSAGILASLLYPSLARRVLPRPPRPAVVAGSAPIIERV